MGITILPKTILCKLSVGLAVITILLFVLSGYLPDMVGVTYGSGSVILIIIATAMGVLGIGILTTGLIGITKRKDRAILVFLALVVGLFSLIVAAGEMSDVLRQP